MEDVYKGNRRTMWISCLIFILTIPAFLWFDRTPREKDLAQIENVVLAKDAEYDPGGGGKGSSAAIELYFEGTDRVFHLSYQEYQCISKKEVLDHFKKGDTVSVKVKTGDQYDFYTKNVISGNTRLYGLAKDGKEYVSLECSNKVLQRGNRAAIIASAVSAFLSLLFATRLLRPKTKYEAIGDLPVDPIFVVLACWVVLMLGLR